MPYVPTVFITGDIITAAKANNWETQYACPSTDLSDASTATGITAPVTDVLGWLANKAKTMQGSTAWTDAPAATLATASSHIAATTLAHGGLTPATHVGAGGAEHAAATTAAAGFMPAAVMARLAGPGLYDAAFPITAHLKCDSSGVLTGSAGLTDLYRYVVATKAYTQHSHGLSTAPMDVVCDSTYFYVVYANSTSYGLRRISLASSSGTELAILVDGALIPDGGIAVRPDLAACWNRGDYIYVLAPFETAASTYHYGRLHRYNIVSSSWFFCEESGPSQDGAWNGTGMCYAADGILRYALYHGTPKLVRYLAWSEATTAALGAQSFYSGEAGELPQFMSGPGEVILFDGIQTSTGGDISGRSAHFNTATTEWHLDFAPDVGWLRLGRFAFTGGGVYGHNSTGGSLFFWQLSS